MAATRGRQQQSKYIFALVPKSASNDFFWPTREGCKDRAEEMSAGVGIGGGFAEVECDWLAPPQEEPSGLTQLQVVNDIIDMRLNGTRHYDGIAVSPKNESVMGPAIRRALDAGMSVICFDNDAEDSDRQAYVGTNNVAMGEQLGRVLLQLQPEGGEYAILATEGHNFGLRVQGIRQVLENSAWKELPDSIAYFKDDEYGPQRGFDKLTELREQHPSLSAIIPTQGIQMSEAHVWNEFVRSDTFHNLTFVSGDAFPFQICALERGLVDGLVGQLPYQMGQCAINTLFELQQDGNPPRNMQNDIIVGTRFNLMLQPPLHLPKITVDQNFIGPLVILGYTLLAILIVCDVGFFSWIIWKRNSRIVRASQPIFLQMLCVGVLIMGLAIIPLSMDDEKYSQRSCDVACNAGLWLISIGLTTTFSALFSKLRRIRIIQQSAQRFIRVTVTPKDVLCPFLVFLTINLVVLTSWAVIAPLRYTRRNHEGTDPWNRHLSTYGTCYSTKNVSPLVGILVVINLGALIYANVQAYLARKIETEYSESKSIAFSVAIMMEAAVIAMPVMLLVHDQPQAEYVVCVIMIFVVSMAVLCCVFIPKIVSPNERTLSGRRRSSTQRRQSQVRFGIMAKISHNDEAGEDKGTTDRTRNQEKDVENL